jgi:hypothetical protein
MQAQQTDAVTAIRYPRRARASRRGPKGAPRADVLALSLWRPDRL